MSSIARSTRNDPRGIASLEEASLDPMQPMQAYVRMCAGYRTHAAKFSRNTDDSDCNNPRTTHEKTNTEPNATLNINGQLSSHHRQKAETVDLGAFQDLARRVGFAPCLVVGLRCGRLQHLLLQLLLSKVQIHLTSFLSSSTSHLSSFLAKYPHTHLLHVSACAGSGYTICIIAKCIYQFLINTSVYLLITAPWPAPAPLSAFRLQHAALQPLGRLACPFPKCRGLDVALPRCRTPRSLRPPPVRDFHRSGKGRWSRRIAHRE